MGTPIEELIEKYQLEAETYSERQKAELERDIWVLAPPAERREVPRDIWFSKKMGVPQNAGAHRCTLINALPDSEPLWERISERGMPLRTAIRLLKEAKQRAKDTGVERSQALLEGLEEYEKVSGNVARLSGGRTVRRRNPNQLPSLKAIPTVRPVGRPRKDDGDRNFWVSIRKEVAGFVAARLQNADPLVAERLWKEFEVDLKVFLDDFQGKMHRTISKERRTLLVASESTVRGKVLWACETLSMDPPTIGTKVNLDKASSQKKKLARLYHPDAHGGDESTTKKYHEVMQAFEILEAFNDRVLSVVVTEKEEPPDGINSKERDAHD